MTISRTMFRTLAAFLLAPLAGCVALGLLLGLPLLLLSGPGSGYLFFAAGSLFSALVAVPTAIVLGVPVFLWMRKRRLGLRRHYLAAGALTGFAIVFVLIAVGTAMGPNFHIGNILLGSFLLLSGALVGGVTGVIGWMVRRPDRDLLEAAA